MNTLPPVIWFLIGTTTGSILAFTVFCMLHSNRNIRKAEEQRELQEAIERTQA